MSRLRAFVATHINFSKRDALFGLVISLLPALVVLSGMHDPSRVHTGLALLFGALPAAVVGLSPIRKERKRILVVGVLLAMSLMLGSLFAVTPFIEIIVLFALALMATWLATRSAFGMVMLTLCVPVTAIGLSYPGIGESWHTGLIMAVGSLVALLLALLFPQFPAAQPKAPANQLLPQSIWLNYGVRLGLTAVTGALIGYAFGLDHMGWIVGCSLFVMRPNWETQKLRSIGRGVSVFIGAFLATVVIVLNPPVWVVTILVVVNMVLMAATHASKAYVTPLFSSFQVLLLLSFGVFGAHVIHRFNQRVLDTLIGIAIAYLFGYIVPRVMAALSARKASTVPSGG